MSDPADVPTGEREPLPRSVSIERALLALVMAALCLITMGNVLVRYFTSMSFAFTEEVSVSLMVVMTLVGASTAYHRNRHIAITFVVDLMRPAMRRHFALGSLCASMMMFGLLAWYGARMACDRRMCNRDLATSLVHLPPMFKPFRWQKNAKGGGERERERD